MAYEAYFKCTFKQQGTSKGESQKADRADWIAVLGFSFEVLSPRDTATGQVSGKRQYKPIGFLKEWGASTPQFLAAAAQNESIDSASFEFVKTNASGSEYVYHTVTLTNGTVCALSQFAGGLTEGVSPSNPGAIGTGQFERISLTFEKIGIANDDGKTSFSDDWEPAA